jgi:uncharacterized protein (DUF1697 family)
MGDDRYFAFLRAINTGNRRLTNERLLAPFHDLGFTDVAAYQAAGNVTFRGGAVDERHIEAALADAYGFETPTFVRTAAAVAAIVHAAPFPPDDLARSAGKVQVTFLRRTASPEQVERVMALVPEDDRVVVSGREWYWLPADGVSTSTLPVGQIEAALGEMTMRTHGTVTRLHVKFSD